MYHKKSGKFQSVAPKRKVAEIPHSFDRHRAKICPNPNFLAYPKSSWTEANMQKENFPASLKSHQCCQKTANNLSVFLSTLQLTAWLWKIFRPCLQCYTLTLLAIEKNVDWKKLKILVQNQSFWDNFGAGPTASTSQQWENNAAGIIIVWWTSPPLILQINSMHKIATGTSSHVPPRRRGIVIAIFHDFGTNCMVPQDWDSAPRFFCGPNFISDLIGESPIFSAALYYDYTTLLLCFILLLVVDLQIHHDSCRRCCEAPLDIWGA